MSLKSLRKDIFAPLFSVHNTTSLSRHEQVWLLIVLNLLHGTIMLLEPVLENNYSDIELVKETGVKLFKNKFSLQNVTAILANKHSLQEDGSSCWVYICYYAKRICDGLSMLFFQVMVLLMRIRDFIHAI